MSSLSRRIWRHFQKFIYSRIFTFEQAYSEKKVLNDAIIKSTKSLNHAWDNLNLASTDFIDIAIMELQVAELELNLSLRKYRLLTGYVNATDKAIITNLALTHSLSYDT